MIQRSPTWKDTLFKQNYIVVQDASLQAPQNPIVSINGDNIILQWDLVDNADSYLIYTTNIPNGEFHFLDYTPNLTYTHSDVLLNEDKLFYRIIGFDGSLTDLARFIKKKSTQ